ncbi:unnamed protein product (macronuclear) [Paramecium tetraurelia]|uniref:Uncharacterized protein n=1 Tax=Paramecium tetraurelia TaxID=5888 RepID=A0CKS1_PARTE|nr:uncharacterized protein GSPATT00001102001 [Paramecium tetraurelia]CAK71388.1 unnamed protein product [Paramecium tetraurelia]|eukprot:XP_001438785.1 hypothetical protein (macronuclear) [Paramecium tetraurelia strain d4-2]
MATQNIFGNFHDNSRLMELYEILQIMKNQSADQLKIQAQEEIFEKFSILNNYLMFNEIQQLAILICKHNKQLQESISMYQYLKQQECQIDKTINVDKLIESYENSANEQDINQNKNDATWYKMLICCAKLLSKKIQNEEDTKIYNKIHKQLNFYIDQNLPSNNPNMLISQISMFHLPFIQYIQLYSSFQLLINTLRYKQYIEFTEKNYQYQTQLLPNILNISQKQSSFHTQIWKFQSILIDVTQNLVNFNELFSVTQHSFKNEGIQRIAFSFNNIQRGFKVMKIILEESILKYFYEQIELKIEEYKSLNHNQVQQKESVQFKPQVHIVFHGLEDINLDNPKQTKLDLEIQIQIGENEFLSLNNQSSNQTLIWNYDKIKHFNLIIQLLVQIFECSQLWIQYMPKSPKEYFEFLCSKVSKQKLEVDRQTLTNWFQKEKPNINNSIESLLALLESIEFLLLKIESNINKEIAKYQKEKPISFNKDKFAKILIQSGFKIEYDLINKIEIRLAETIKNNLESILNQISPKTQQIKGIVQLIKKITPNFK